MKFQLVIVFFSCCLQVMGQKSVELDRINGYKDIKLGQPLDTTLNIVFISELKEKNEFTAKLYQIKNPEFMTIGEIVVNNLEVKTYKDLVYAIMVTTEKDPRLMKALERNFGVSKFNPIAGTYNWSTKNISLSFKKKSENELLLTYIYFPVLEMVAKDKDKKIDEIASDF